SRVRRPARGVYSSKPTQKELLAMPLRIAAGVVALAFLGVSPAHAQGPAIPAQSWPDEDWELSTPAAEGIDAKTIAALDADLRAGRYGYVDAMVVIRHGRIIAEHSYPRDYATINAPLIEGEPGPWNYHDANWHPYFRGSQLHTLQSTTKSFASALAGIAIAQGRIRGVDATLGELLPHRQISDPAKAAITLDNVLTMRPGFEWLETEVSYWDPRNDSIRVEKTNDWTGYLLAKPLVTAQGSTYTYNSTNSQMISEIVSTAVGKGLDAFAEETLFGPLGIREYQWKSAPEGYRDTAGGLYLSARDLARFGLLFLRGGEWNGKQLIPADWVARSLETHVRDTEPADPAANFGYDYQWWVFEHGSEGRPRMVGTWGWGGQFALLVPALDLVAVFTGWNTYDGQEDIAPVLAFYERVVLPAAAR
ncbi:MAG: serine hydrolase domain-containing protein, partial [Gammaproteobacteria bacterium]